VPSVGTGQYYLFYFLRALVSIMLNKLAVRSVAFLESKNDSEFQPASKKTELFRLCQFFVFMFALVFVEVNKLPLYFYPMPALEQWSNLLPNFFSGEQDFLFSYGPLYWLQGSTVAQHSELTYFISAIFVSIFTALNWAIILRLAIKFRAVIFLAVIYGLYIKSYYAYVMFFTLPFFVLVYIRAINLDNIWDDKRFVFLMALVVAFLFYFRFFYGMIAILTLGSYLFSIQALKRKYAMLIFFICNVAILYVIFGLLIFHNTQSVINYLAVNSQLNFGNSVDMNYDVTIKFKAYMVILATVACFNIYLIKFQRELLLTVNGLLLIFLKIGFSRADHYISYFIFPVVLLSFMFLLNRERIAKLLPLTILPLMLFLGQMSIFDGAPRMPLLTKHEDFTNSFEDRAAQRYAEFKLQDDIVDVIGKKTVDVYPINNEYALANKLNYHHRPSFQNYMTLTPELDKINVDFFNSPEAPEFVLWTASVTCGNADCDAFDDFDGKYVLNEDPLTTLAILNKYSVVRVFADKNNKPLMLLKRNVSGSNVQEQQIGDVKSSFGQWIKIPFVADSLVKVKPDFKLTPLAKLQNLFFHGSVLYVNYKLSSGEVKRYRLNIINAQSGVWVSPLLNSFPLSGQRVIEVMFETTDTHYFKKEFNATLETFKIPGIKSNEAKFSVFTEDKPRGYNELKGECGASIDSVQQSEITVAQGSVKRLNSSGWAAFSIEKNLAPQAVWLTLSDQQGRKYFVPVERTPRQDVANVFQKPDLVNSGYKVFADITPFKGDYKVGLAVAGEGKLLECANFAQPITIQ